MPRCEVSIRHSRIRKNVFLDDAKDDADAIRQFHERFNLPPLLEKETAWPIQVNWLGAPAPEATAVEVKSPPKSATEAIAAEVAEAEPAFSPVGVSELKKFGLDDSDVFKLANAKLTTVSAIVSYAKVHKGLKDIPDVDVAVEKRIKAAIRSYQNSQL